MKTKISNDQSGLAHIGIVAVALLVVAAVGLVGYRLANNNSQDKGTSLSTTDQSSSDSVKHISPNVSSKSTIAPNTTANGSSSSTAGTSTAKPKTSAPAATSSSATASAPQANYSNLGSIPASSLYNVKSPPASNQQPNINIYACIKNLGGNTAYVQAYGVLSYPVAQGSAGAWYVSLSLSSSPGAENIISSKSGQYTYSTNSWQNSGAPAGTANKSAVITTANFNPGVISDFYIWASGSYGSSVWANLNNHPNATQLGSC